MRFVIVLLSILLFVLEITALTRRIVVTFDTQEHAVAYTPSLGACGRLVRQYGRRALLDVKHEVTDLVNEQNCITQHATDPTSVVLVEEDHVIRTTDINF